MQVIDLSAILTLLWNAFEAAHHKATLPGRLEIPMESFARAVEIVLKDSELRDAPGYCPDASSLAPDSTVGYYVGWKEQSLSVSRECAHVPFWLFQLPMKEMSAAAPSECSSPSTVALHRSMPFNTV
jgi:hypothetical protein